MQMRSLFGLQQSPYYWPNSVGSVCFLMTPSLFILLSFCLYLSLVLSGLFWVDVSLVPRFGSILCDAPQSVEHINKLLQMSVLSFTVYFVDSFDKSYLCARWSSQDGRWVFLDNLELDLSFSFFKLADEFCCTLWLHIVARYKTNIQFDLHSDTDFPATPRKSLYEITLHSAPVSNLKESAFCLLCVSVHLSFFNTVASVTLLTCISTLFQSASLDGTHEQFCVILLFNLMNFLHWKPCFVFLFLHFAHPAEWFFSAKDLAYLSICGTLPRLVAVTASSTLSYLSSTLH